MAWRLNPKTELQKDAIKWEYADRATAEIDPFGDLPEMPPLLAPLVFVANVPGIAFEEVQRRANKV